MGCSRTLLDAETFALELVLAVVDLSLCVVEHAHLVHRVLETFQPASPVPERQGAQEQIFPYEVVEAIGDQIDLDDLNYDSSGGLD